MKKLLAMLVMILVMGSACDPLESPEYLQLMDSTRALAERLDSVEGVLAALRQTPGYYLQAARNARADGKRLAALSLVDTLVLRFPDSDEFSRGEQLRRELRNEVADSLLDMARGRIEANNFVYARNLRDQILQDYADTRAVGSARALAPQIERAERQRDAEQEERRRAEADRRARAGAELEIVDFRWSRSSGGGYAQAEGRVKNISGSPMENVVANVAFTDASGGFITSDDALIDLNPILPDQVSTFTVMATHNPAMDKASLTFQYLMGGSIPTYRER